jgi:hypothetical protein
MRPEEIKLIRDYQPFAPFRLIFTDGREFKIKQRDHLFITRHTLSIAVEINPVTGIPKEAIHASPLHVERVEMLRKVA